MNFPVSFNTTKNIVLLLLAGMLSNNAFAQIMERSQPLYRNFTYINSSLPSNSVYKMATDGYGYIWIATERGLVRYDGNVFKQYTAPQTDNEFVQVYKPNDSTLWLFGYSGNSRLFNLSTHTFRTVLDTPNTAPFKSPVVLAWQKNDTLSLYRTNSTFSQAALSNPNQQWLAGKASFINSLLARWKIPNHAYGITADTLSALFNHKPYAIQITGDVLILGNKIFRQNGDAPATPVFNGDSKKITGNISSFVRMGDDLYLGFVETQELLLIKNFFSTDSRVQHTYSKILTQVPVTSLVCDYQGNLWVGTLGKGIYLFTPADLATRHLQQARSDAPDRNITGISRLDNGLTALGHNHDRASILYNEKQAEISLSGHQSINEVRAVYKVADKWFFFGNQNSYAGTGVSVPGKIMPLAISKHTPFKDGTMLNNRYYFTTKSACFIIDNDGNISTDTMYKGINTLTISPLNDSVCFYGTNDGIYRNGTKLQQFSSTRITKLRTIGSKLVVCTQEGAFVVQLTEKGEPANSFKILTENCYDIKADSSYCYIKTGSGLAIFNTKDWKLVNEINAGTYALSINDYLVEGDTLTLATNEGVYYIPKRLACYLKNIVTPKIYLSCSLTGFDPSKNIAEITYSKKLSITLSADLLDYTSKSKHIDYQITYNGEAISNWQTMSDRAITLNNLKPGKYTVTIKARAGYSGMENSASHTIVIHPLWYQRTWISIFFWCFIAAIIGFITFRWYKAQLHKAKKNMNDQLRMNELENKNLFAQLKPHFIFNVLTPLQSYFIDGDDIGGLKYLDNYAKLMRGFLQESRESYITIEKEVDFLKHYLFIQQQRFSNGFTYSFEIDPRLSLSQLFVPTLILQPIVENAVEHGVKNATGTNGSIRIKLMPDDNKVIASVIDNGDGFKNSDTSFQPNHALQIIKERLELIRLKHGAGMLRITSNGAQPGTTITIELPLLNSTMI
ncbi:MAG: histidine kinase [Filimonas sp.]|nr:histidine kinase [Filimonas sp.]